MTPFLLLRGWLWLFSRVFGEDSATREIVLGFNEVDEVVEKAEILPFLAEGLHVRARGEHGQLLPQQFHRVENQVDAFKDLVRREFLFDEELHHVLHVHDGEMLMVWVDSQGLP